VQVRPASGCGALRIGYDDRLAVRVRADGHPHQLTLGGSRTTSDTGPDRFTCHQGSTLPLTRSFPEPGAHGQGGSVARVALGAGDPTWFEERFPGPELDPRTWLPHYLPAWSSRAASRAAFRIDDRGLTLELPVDHPVWCAGDHEPPLRVSGIQSASWSGPAGSTLGQQRFREGQVVREPQQRFEGWLPSAEHGPARVEISARMDLSPRSMAALWLSGVEDDEAQQRCGELCVFEVFGKDLGPAQAPSAEVGMGVKAFRDPALTHDFAAPRLAIDVAEPHLYAVDWDASEAVFSVDGRPVRRCARPPSYPLQLMLAVFDFPGWSRGDDDHLVPRMVVDRVAGSPYDLPPVRHHDGDRPAR